MKQENTKEKTIAILLHGGIGKGHQLQGIPVVNELIDELAKRNRIYVYQLSEADDGFTPGNYVLRAYPFRLKFRWLVVLWLFVRFSSDHRKQRFSVIHAIRAYPAGYLALQLGKIFKIKILVSFQGGDATFIPHIGFGLMNRFLKKIAAVVKKAEAVTVLSKFQEKELRRQLEINREITVIPYGADPQVFFCTRASVAETPLQLLHIADLNPVKDQETLLLAVAEISLKKDCRLTIAGRDTLGGRLQQKAAELGIKDKVTFTGTLPRTELPALLHKSHFLLHTSLYEGQAVVVNEALACGVPVIGTRTGIIADLENTCTVAVNVGDFKALAAEVIRLSENKEHYLSLQKKGLEWTQLHLMKHTVEAYEKLYKDISGND